MIKIERNEVTKPGQSHEVLGMGMPIYQKPGEFGKLIIKVRRGESVEGTGGPRRSEERGRKDNGGRVGEGNEGGDISRMRMEDTI